MYLLYWHPNILTGNLENSLVNNFTHFSLHIIHHTLKPHYNITIPSFHSHHLLPYFTENYISKIAKGFDDVHTNWREYHIVFAVCRRHLDKLKSRNQSIRFYTCCMMLYNVMYSDLCDQFPSSSCSSYMLIFLQFIWMSFWGKFCRFPFTL